MTFALHVWYPDALRWNRMRFLSTLDEVVKGIKSNVVGCLPDGRCEVVSPGKGYEPLTDQRVILVQG